MASKYPPQYKPVFFTLKSIKMLVLSILSTLLSSVSVTVVLMLKDQSNSTARLQKEFESRLRTLEFDQKRDVEKLTAEFNLLRIAHDKLPYSKVGESERGNEFGNFA